MMEKTENVYLGKFTIKSGKVMVSDPCYKKGTWCQGVIEKVKKGLWTGQAVITDEGEWGKRVAELIATSDYPCASDCWNKEKFDAGVDSGQMSIVDLKQYRGGEDEYGAGGWYDKCCDITLGRGKPKDHPCAGTMEGGVVSSSGFGDGGYDCYTKKNEDGEIVAIKVVFISDEEEEEEEDEESEE